jgi:glycine cleavage system H lipoate-binding protein
MIASDKKGDLILVEASRNNMEVLIPAEGIIAATNMFVSEKMKVFDLKICLESDSEAFK